MARDRDRSQVPITRTAGFSPAACRARRQARRIKSVVRAPRAREWRCWADQPQDHARQRRDRRVRNRARLAVPLVVVGRRQRHHGATEAIRLLLAKVKLDKSHPARQADPHGQPHPQFSGFDPYVQERCEFTLDRRLLPARTRTKLRLRSRISPRRSRAEGSVSTSLFDRRPHGTVHVSVAGHPDSPIVRALLPPQSDARARGRDFSRRSAFDQGYLNQCRDSTANFGAASTSMRTPTTTWPRRGTPRRGARVRLHDAGLFDVRGFPSPRKSGCPIAHYRCGLVSPSWWAGGLELDATLRDLAARVKLHDRARRGWACSSGREG